jgi:hypothetical protein
MMRSGPVMAWVSGATVAPEVCISTAMAAPVSPDPRTTTCSTRAIFLLLSELLLGEAFCTFVSAGVSADMGADNNAAMPSTAPK